MVTVSEEGSSYKCENLQEPYNMYRLQILLLTV